MNASVPPGSTSLVSRELLIEGEISGEESLHVDGRVKGFVRLSGDLFVGAGGVVEAEVEARNVVVQGSLAGKVTARQQLEIQPTGRFHGECTAASFEIREGAVFEGTSRMIDPAAAKSGSRSAAAKPA
ncbi:MAG: polymer-forming cytoskeletal protein [Desulfobacterales bacterium]|jgi:cytoskeletal protein CcmA (bactofilin family)|nr:polymer-forming cytoskeletal protein [Desulfobacterales bacterium]